MLDEREAGSRKQEIGRAFNRQSLKTRAAIVVAGGPFQLLFAILAFWLVLVFGETGSPAPAKWRWVRSQRRLDSAWMMNCCRLPIALHPVGEAAVYALLRESVEGSELAVNVLDRDGYHQTRVIRAINWLALSDGGYILDGWDCRQNVRASHRLSVR